MLTFEDLDKIDQINMWERSIEMMRKGIDRNRQSLCATNDTLEARDYERGIRMLEDEISRLEKLSSDCRSKVGSHGYRRSRALNSPFKKPSLLDISSGSPIADSVSLSCDFQPHADCGSHAGRSGRVRP